MFVLALCLSACAASPTPVSGQSNTKTAPLPPISQANISAAGSPLYAPRPAPDAPPVAMQQADNANNSTAAVPLNVALLLPLTGRNAELGQSMLNAAQMALFETGANINLLPRDVGDTPQSAVAAASLAVADGAQLLVGPIAGAQIEAVAQSTPLPMLALGNDRRVAGNNVYLLGFWPEAQVERVVRYAAQQRISRIAALLPEGAFGDALVAALAESTPRAGSTLVQVVRYGANSQSQQRAVQQLAAAMPFEGLFLAEAGQPLQQLLAQFVSYDLRLGQGLQLLSTGIWDDAALSQVQPLQGAWFATPDPAARASFVQRYQQQYGDAPQRRASLAYDALALAGALAKQGGVTDAGLQSFSGFVGVDGLFRLNANRLVERALAVIEINRNGNVVRDRAAQAFR